MSELPKTIDTFVLIPEDYVKREWCRLLKEAGYTRKSLDYEEMLWRPTLRNKESSSLL